MGAFGNTLGQADGLPVEGPSSSDAAKRRGPGVVAEGVSLVALEDSALLLLAAGGRVGVRERVGVWRGEGGE